MTRASRYPDLVSHLRSSRVRLKVAPALRSVVAILVGVLAATGATLNIQAAEPVDYRDSLPVWKGAWQQEALLPFEPRVGASVAVEPGASHGVTIWGGTAADGRMLQDGLEVDSDDPARSRAIPAAPIRSRRDYGWASRDGQVYIWGGIDETGAALADGAEFGTAWTEMPDAPLPAGPASMVVVEDRLWVVAQHPETGGAVASSIRVPLEPGAGWTSVMDIPVPPGERYDVLGCCHEEANWLFVFSLQTEGLASAAAFDPAQETWTEVGPVPVPPLPVAGPVAGRALEEDIAAWVGRLRTQDATAAVTLSLAHPSEPWVVSDEVATTPGTPGAGALVLGPSHLVQLRAGMAYDLVDRQWLRLPSQDTPGWLEAVSGGDAWWDRGRLWVLARPPAGPDAQSVLWSFTPEPPRGTYALPTGRRPSGERAPCIVFGQQGTWRLRGDPQDPRLVWVQNGARRQYLDWPDGWHVRFKSPRLVVTDSAGKVRYRGGQTCPALSGTGG